MTLSFSLFNGLIASWYSVMNITFSGLPIGEADDADRCSDIRSSMYRQAHLVANLGWIVL